MAKANLCFNRTGNDGYKMARREDGKWFIQERYYGQRFGWTQTKWKECDGDHITIQECLKAHDQGETCTHIGFGHLVVFTDGKGLRLP